MHPASSCSSQQYSHMNSYGNAHPSIPAILPAQILPPILMIIFFVKILSLKKSTHKPPWGIKKCTKKHRINGVKINKSDRRGSNPRSRPWQGRALPTTPLSLICLTAIAIILYNNIVVNTFFYFYIKLRINITIP